MTQISLASSQQVTVAFDSTISGAVASAGLIKITTSAAHGLSTGAVVQIASVTGTVEANGQWTITVINSTSFTLNNSTFANAYVSGGSCEHVGQVIGSALVDASVFTSVPTNICGIFELESAPFTSTLRVIFEDAADAAYVTALPLYCFGAAGTATTITPLRKSFRFADAPDWRIGNTSDHVRVILLFSESAQGASFTFSSWLEY